MHDRDKSIIQVSQDGISARQPILNPKVSIFCPQCDAGQEIEMNLFWKRGYGTHRFIEWACENRDCRDAHGRPHKIRTLGHWLRFQSDPNSKISTWLKEHEVYKDKERPVTMTSTVYMAQDTSTTSSSRKRKRESHAEPLAMKMSNRVRTKLLGIAAEPSLGCGDCRYCLIGCPRCILRRDQWRAVWAKET